MARVVGMIGESRPSKLCYVGVTSRDATHFYGGFMKHGFVRKGPVIRMAFGIAAVLVTMSIGGFIDFLATDNVALIADLLHGPLLVAERK
ncbi:MAG: hypothetical protein ACRECQ_01865 [Burkholderiaceae bacterium]